MPGAVCTGVDVVATVQLGSFEFVVNATLPVVYLGHMAVSSSGYPDVGSNRDLNVTTLGLVACLSDGASPAPPPAPPGMPSPPALPAFPHLNYTEFEEG